MVIHATTDEFKSVVLESKVPVLVDFWAEWCGPCRMLAPTLDKLAEELEGKASIVKIDVDAEKAIAAQYEVSSIPTLLVFKDGQLMDRRSGVMNIKQLKSMLGMA
ncbi:MAG: thioredoxin [Firmicutes bacterium]|nr:thioredoxin [Bacillota bacterium]MCL1953892.1 thioredoxin [Bacillota bacterium]